jgi:hypothetical protein
VDRRPESVCIDGLRLLLDNHEKESYGRFIGGFRRDDLSLTAAAINERKYWPFVSFIRSSSVFREATRARLSVVLATFPPGRDVEIVDLDRVSEINRWRVECSGELFDAPVNQAIRNVSFSV